MALTIISLIKQVPLPSEMRMGEDGLMDRTKAKSSINMDCQYGLEAGLQLKKVYPDARLMVCSMGPKSFEASLRKALAMGYDEAYLLSDRKLGGSDTFATVWLLPHFAETNWFLLMTGKSFYHSHRQTNQ
jgi:electron transfer flavoprotein alpha/beta subunit